MYTFDDRETAKIGDRMIAAVIGGLFGFLIGLVLARGVDALFGARYGIDWIIAALFAAYAFVAPSRSRALWSAFWEEVLGWLSSRK